MKLLISLLLLASIKSNGQKYIKPDTTYKLARSGYLLSKGWKASAIIRSNSNTLEMLDSVFVLYEHRIRYIKIKDKVYPLLTPKP